MCITNIKIVPKWGKKYETRNHCSIKVLIKCAISKHLFFCCTTPRLRCLEDSAAGKQECLAIEWLLPPMKTDTKMLTSGTWHIYRLFSSFCPFLFACVWLCLFWYWSNLLHMPEIQCLPYVEFFNWYFFSLFFSKVGPASPANFWLLRRSLAFKRVVTLVTFSSKISHFQE